MRLGQLPEKDAIKNELFQKGVESFNKRQYYNAHELWEDLWSDYYLVDANFVQGLIQLSVGYFHITNLNINGANGLLSKSIKKLELYSPTHRDIDVRHLVESAYLSIKNLSEINTIKDFNWACSPLIRYINE